ncbi:MAG: hypothetical protein ACREXT_05435 [Gammaproteobacteria bacterium]
MNRPAWQRLAIGLAATRAGAWFYINTYQARAGRRIPVLVLEPITG